MGVFFELLPWTRRVRLTGVRVGREGLVLPGRRQTVAALGCLGIAAFCVLVPGRAGLKPRPATGAEKGLGLFFGALAAVGLSARRDVLIAFDGSLHVRRSFLGLSDVRSVPRTALRDVDLVQRAARGRGGWQTSETLVVALAGGDLLDLAEMRGLDLLRPAREALYLKLARHFATVSVAVGPGLARYEMPRASGG